MKVINCLLLYIIFFVFLNHFVESQNNTKTISCVIYDQYPLFNPNFEPPYGYPGETVGNTTQGLVKSTLDPIKRVPEIANSSVDSSLNIKGGIVRPDLYQYLFSPNNDPSSIQYYSTAIPINLTLVHREQVNTYYYSTTSFYPIDYMGYDLDASKRNFKYNGTYHNYHFTLRYSSQFKYKAGDKFSCFSTDDLYIFIDNKLALDMGGIHFTRGLSVKVDTLGLVLGETYSVDLFYFQRHIHRISRFQFETNADITCGYTDYCGVCNGNGDSCCNPLVHCNDNDLCTDDKCPPPTTIIGNSSISNYCIHTLKQVPSSNNICFINQCNATSGEVAPISINCQDRSNECLISLGCNPSTGCEYESYCNDICQVKDQCNNGTCIVKSSEYCAQELDGNNIDLCKVYSCDSTSGNGCIKQDKCQQSSNKCIITSCNSLNGECIYQDIPNPYSNNSCIKSTCNPDTGIYSTSSIDCQDKSNECLELIGCNPSTGCEYKSYCNGTCEPPKSEIHSNDNSIQSSSDSTSLIITPLIYVCNNDHWNLYNELFNSIT